jgi:hypothetical protein
MKLYKIIPWLLLITVPPVFSVPLEDLLDAAGRTELLNGEIITRVQQRDPRPVLIPRHAYTRMLIDSLLVELDANLMVESLSLYKKNAVSAGTWSAVERAALYNEALALSSLTGLQYFSTSRNRMRTFYELSQVIDGPETQRVVLDPVYTEPPAELSLYARQKDLTFGENIYRYTYYARSDALLFVQENLTTMNAGIIPAVGKDKLRAAVAVIDAEEYLLIYAASMARAASIPGMSRRVSNSFSTRVEAILGWFAGQADKAFR